MKRNALVAMLALVCWSCQAIDSANENLDRQVTATEGLRSDLEVQMDALNRNFEALSQNLNALTGPTVDLINGVNTRLDDFDRMMLNLDQLSQMTIAFMGQIKPQEIMMALETMQRMAVGFQDRFDYLEADLRSKSDAALATGLVMSKALSSFGLVPETQMEQLFELYSTAAQPHRDIIETIQDQVGGQDDAPELDAERPQAAENQTDNNRSGSEDISPDSAASNPDNVLLALIEDLRAVDIEKPEMIAQFQNDVQEVKEMLAQATRTLVTVDRLLRPLSPKQVDQFLDHVEVLAGSSQQLVGKNGELQKLLNESDLILTTISDATGLLKEFCEAMKALSGELLNFPVIGRNPSDVKKKIGHICGDLKKIVVNRK